MICHLLTQLLALPPSPCAGQPMDAAPSGAPSTPASGSVEADSGQMPISREAALDVLATRYVDEALLNALAATSTNTIEGGDYRWVCMCRLLGSGAQSCCTVQVLGWSDTRRGTAYILPLDQAPPHHARDLIHVT